MVGFWEEDSPSQELLFDEHRELTAVDLFAGSGGFSLGLKRAGFRVVLASEFSTEPEWTYRTNLIDAIHENSFLDKLNGFDNAQMRRHEARKAIGVNRVDKHGDTTQVMRGGDIKHSLSNEWLKQWKSGHQKEVDIVVAGPPCQGFSSAGNKSGEDARNGLVWEALRVCEQINPKMIAIENVPGMLLRHFDLVKSIMDKMSRLNTGYWVFVELLPGEVFGVPQTRKRLFIVGIRKDLVSKCAVGRLSKVIFPRSCPLYRPFDSFGFGRATMRGQHLSTAVVLSKLDLYPSRYQNQSDTMSEYVDDDLVDSYFTREVQSLKCVYFGGASILKDERVSDAVANHESSTHSLRVQKRLGLIREIASQYPENRLKSSWLKEKIRERYPSLVTKKSARKVLLPDHWPGLTVTSLPDDIVHHKVSRIPTVREMARLQTFPDWFTFMGVRTTGAERRKSGVFIPQYTQVANAVPPRLAFAVSSRWRQLLLSIDEDPKCRFELEGGGYQPTSATVSFHDKINQLNGVR